MKQNTRLEDGFGQVSSPVMREPTLSLQEKGFYAYLSSYASSTDNSLIVKTYRMASECNVTPSTISRMINKLQKLGVLTRVKRGKGNTWKTILLK